MNTEPNMTPLPMKGVAVISPTGAGTGSNSGANSDPGNTGGATKKASASADDVAAIATLMMLNQQPDRELPELKTGQWPHQGVETPDPITIEKARKLLAAGYAKIPCEVPGSGTHGYAWMVERGQRWNKRTGVIPLVSIMAPRQAIRPVTMEPQLMVRHTVNKQAFHLYNHLKEEGKEKMIGWFGEELFVDMHTDGELPTEVTPREMLDHLSETYAKPHHYRKHMNQAEADFNCKYDVRKPVEVYFMRLQEARDKAELLEQPFTEKQTINKALNQFEKQHGNDANKAEKKWNEKSASDRTWTNFKKHWKEYIHTWKSTTTGAARSYHVEALQAEMEGVRMDLSALQAENHSYQQENHELRTQQFEIQQALQAERDSRSNRSSSKTSSDDISALTEAVWSLVQKSDDNKTDREQDKDSESNRTVQGGNMTHWTRQCRSLTQEEKRKYRNANGFDRMGGNDKFADRVGKYASDFSDS